MSRIASMLAGALTSDFRTFYNGTKIPAIGLGTFDIEDSEPIVTAIETGYRLIDTAFIYKNEEFIGKALSQMFRREHRPVKRVDMFIVSKLPNNGHRKVFYFLEKSLKALGLDYLDLYLIHSPLSIRGIKDDDMFRMEDGTCAVDREVDLVKTWKSMEEAVDLGYTKNIGLSNFNSKQIQRIYDNARIKPANLQVECHPFLPQTKLRNYCKERNIVMTAYGPLGAPHLPEIAARYCLPADPHFPNLLAHPLLVELAGKYQRTPAQISLRWLIQKGVVAIPKSCCEHRQASNFDVFSFSLSPEDEFRIDYIRKRYRFFAMNHMPGLEEHPQYPFHEN